MGIDGGWTKTPNVILEAMPEMGQAELKLTVVLVRMTYGYHEDSVRLTYDDMVEAANLSRGGLSNAISAIEKRGFFRRGNKSMWYVNSLPGELNSIDQSLPSRLNSTKQTGEIVNPVDQNSLPSRPNNTSNKKEENNIYIPPDPLPVATMKTAISRAVKTPMWEKTEQEYHDAAMMLIGWDATHESITEFGEWWKVNGWHAGLPELSTMLKEYRNYLAGVKHLNGNGTHGNTIRVRSR